MCPQCECFLDVTKPIYSETCAELIVYELISFYYFNLFYLIVPFYLILGIMLSIKCMFYVNCTLVFLLFLFFQCFLKEQPHDSDLWGIQLWDFWGFAPQREMETSGTMKLLSLINSVTRVKKHIIWVFSNRKRNNLFLSASLKLTERVKMKVTGKL